MYPNIKAELARKDMSIVELSTATGINLSTLYGKLKGDYKFTVDEAMNIKTAIGVDIPIEVLFKKKEATV